MQDAVTEKEKRKKLANLITDGVSLAEEQAPERDGKAILTIKVQKAKKQAEAMKRERDSCMKEMTQLRVDQTNLMAEYKMLPDTEQRRRKEMEDNSYERDGLQARLQQAQRG